MNCIFCKIIDEQIPSHKIWENQSHFAFLDINPINPGHVLLIPKKHGEYIFDLDDLSYQELLKSAKNLSNVIKKATGAKRIGMVVEGFLVPHIHIHLVPINEGGELHPARAKKADDEELIKIADIIRNAL
ncbi:MAG: HIT family protein [Candidatus Micrarchaeota archaeon]